MGILHWLSRLFARRPEPRPLLLRVPDASEPVHVHPQRCPLNAPGPFYSLGNCMACGLPEGEAPELLASIEGDNSTTYFIRQPQTPDEVEHACSAIHVCCIGDLRYGGTDPDILRMFGNDGRLSDFVIRDGVVIPHVGPTEPGGK